MGLSISPTPNLSLATRLIDAAKKQGYAGEGALNFPIQNSSGMGTVNVVISDKPLDRAPPGTILLSSSDRKFHQAALDDDGNFKWNSLDEEANIAEYINTSAGATPIQLPPLPKPPAPHEGDWSIIKDPVNAINADAASVLRGDDGNLKIGVGNSAAKMVTATNGEIALAAACRYYRKGPNVSALDEQPPLYPINVANSLHQAEHDWTWVYGFGLVDTTNGDSILKLYDVSLVVTNLSNNRKLNFVLFENAKGQIELLDSRNDLHIIDNTTDASGSFYLNIQRIKFYVERLRADLSIANKTPISDYSFVLSAKRKIGDFPAVTVQWAATIEDTDMSMIVDQVTTVGVAPNKVSLKANGQLMHGSGNHSTMMVVASNGEMELAGACRYYRRGAGNALPDESGDYPIYKINVANSTDTALKDWVWVYSLALLTQKNGMALTDVYDVTMRVMGPYSELVFVGSWDGTHFHFINEEHELDIVDNSVPTTGQYAQNIQRVRFYAEQLIPDLGSNTGSPIGDYTFELRAKRKLGNTPDVVCKWGAEVIDFIPPPPPPPEPEPEEPVVVSNVDGMDDAPAEDEQQSQEDPTAD